MTSSSTTVSASTASGSGADLNISSDTSGNYTVTINSGGAGSSNPYVVGETFTIDGTLIGGTTPTHDVTITVSAVDGNGLITSATATYPTWTTNASRSQRDSFQSYGTDAASSEGMVRDVV